ncbi:hypothetical protein [Sphingobacterium sp. UBA1498]|uniref:hypothetical protein n=1 Tax=Sphingobacterium sp. UBA1498 TaxID=1947481 RepID=UPI0025F1981C|nr:hypothetical protein [Sphingobacterium sp. UBA1498]
MKKLILNVILFIMERFFLFLCFLVLPFSVTFGQTSAPLGPAPSAYPTFNYSSLDNFRATKIVEAKKGNDGDWYCLVKLEALSIKNNRPDIASYIDGPYFYNGVYILDNSAIYPSPSSKQYYHCHHNSVGYDPNIPGRNIVSKYKCYNQYGPSGEMGFFIWLKANYATTTQIGIVPNPGENGIPLPNYVGGNEYDLMYSINGSYKKGWPFSSIVFAGWYVRMESYPDGNLGPRQEPLKIDLLIARPN